MCETGISCWLLAFGRFHLFEKDAGSGECDDGREDVSGGAGDERAETTAGNEDETDRDHGHEDCGNKRHPIVGRLLVEAQIDGDGPQREGREQLISPREILPDYLEARGRGKAENQETARN